MQPEEEYRSLGLLDSNLWDDDEIAVQHWDGNCDAPLDGDKTSMRLDSTHAPFSSNERTTSRCPPPDAIINDVQPLLFRESTLAPFWSNKRTTSECPYRDAEINGVQP